jgi:phosphonate transport system substrate-binding protein
MRLTTSRRLFLTALFLSSCGARRSASGSSTATTSNEKGYAGGEQLAIGTLSYGSGKQPSAQYDGVKQYLEQKLHALIQIEPTFNESKALERIRAKAWDLVFAPPGLAAIAISQYQYTALLPLEGINNLRSILVVKKDSTYQDLRSLAGKKLAIGQPGSATGYYFPIYNFYGLTLGELIVTSTPKAILEAVAQGSADVGALSLQEFNTYKGEIPQAEFRIVFTDPHKVPTGAILASATVDIKLQESIHRILKDSPSTVAQEAAFIPTGEVPDYKYMISVVDRVRSIFPADQAQTAALLTKKPVRLFKQAIKEKGF